MRVPARFPLALLACVVLAGPPAGAASVVAYRADNPQLEAARSLFAKGEFAAAEKAAESAAALPGNSPQLQAQIAALRASALLAQPDSKDRRAAADEALVQLFHADPNGTALRHASAVAQARAQALKGERLLLLHDPILKARSDRPLLIHARLSGAPAGAVRVQLVYRLEPQAADQSGHDDEYVVKQLDLQRNGAFEGYLRPSVGGMPTGGEHVLRYYLEARSPEGVLLDANGSAREPIRAQLTAQEQAGQPSSAATVDEGAKRAPPPEGPPWYKNWRVVGAVGGAAVAIGVVAFILLQPKPQPPVGTLGRVDLP